MSFSDALSTTAKLESLTQGFRSGCDNSHPTYQHGYNPRHYNYLKSINQKRVITYINFVEKYYKSPEKVNSTNFFNQVENAFEWVEAKREDIFVMSYYAWLKSKMEKKPLYDVTLNLVAQASSFN